MITKVGKSELLEEASELIKNGEVVAFPTETVYGLGADALNESAVRKIFEAKGRPSDNPLIVHIASVESLGLICKNIPESAYLLFEKLSPGPLTLILEKREEVPFVTTAGLNTVGVRIPNHNLALELIRRSGRAIAAPSANTSGRISPTNVNDTLEDLLGKVHLILDGGDSVVGVESTVLDLTKETPTILRPGAYTEEDISKVIGKVINHKGKVLVAEAPGMKYTHYAPKCPAVGAESIQKAKEMYFALKKQNPVIIGAEEFVSEAPDVNTISLGVGAEENMKNLFRAMREAEKKYSYIIIQSFENRGRYTALYNRISKATGGKKDI